MSALYPNLGDSRITPIWQPQPGPQTDLVTCPVFEVFYGGARGGGKTEASIGDWFLHSGQWGERAAGLFVRRKLTQLSDAIKRFRRYGAKIGAKWHEQKKELTMPNGAVLKFAYLERDEDAEEYQGHEYTRIYVEEVTNFPFPDPIMKLKGSCRSSAGIPCGIRLTGNPGGPGHHWVKARYIDPAPKGYLVIEQLEKIEIEDGVFVESIIDRVFIPAKLKDNKELLRNDPGYVQRLRETGSAALVKAWLEGDWDGVDGTFFSEFSEEKHVLRGVLQLPAHWTKFRAMDWGSAAPFSVGWYAVSDGEILAPRGALIKYAEWYGWNGQPNKGLKMSADSVARGIINREKDMKQRLSYGVADPSIFSNNGGPSIAEMMLIAGCGWIRGDNARQAGWEQMRKRLAADEPLLLFHESCEHTIRTLPYLQHDEKNPEDLDCWVAGTLIATHRGAIPIEQLKLNDRILTPLGECAILRLYLSGTGATNIVELSNGKKLQGTPHHKVYIRNKGLVALSELQPGDELLEPPKWLMSSNTMVLNIGSTLANITTLPLVAARAYIAKSGKTLMEKSRQGMTSIIKTRIRKIIPLRTLKPALSPSIAGSTLPHGCSTETWEEFSQFGDKLLRAKKLFAKTPQKCTPEPPSEHWRARIVEKFLQRDTRSSGIATKFVKRLFLNCNLSWIARFVKNLSRLNVVLRSRLEPVRILAVGRCEEETAVYNLTVDRAHLYYANGILSSNTDAEDHAVDETRYAVMSRPTLRDKPKVSETDLTKARAMPTINELLAGSIKARQMEEQRY